MYHTLSIIIEIIYTYLLFYFLRFTARFVFRFIRMQTDSRYSDLVITKRRKEIEFWFPSETSFAMMADWNLIYVNCCGRGLVLTFWATLRPEYKIHELCDILTISVDKMHLQLACEEFKAYSNHGTVYKISPDHSTWWPWLTRKYVYIFISCGQKNVLIHSLARIHHIPNDTDHKWMNNFMDVASATIMCGLRVSI